MKFDFAIYFIKQEDSSWKISFYLLKMLNEPDGIIFDRFGESLKLLKKIIKQMQMIEELQEGEVEGYVCSLSYLDQNYRRGSFLSIQQLFFHNKSLWIRKDKFGRFQ